MLCELTNEERVCLKTLSDISTPDGELCYHSKAVALVTGLELQATRSAMKSLTNLGFTQLFQGLMDEDGQTAGSGYCITDKGIKLLECQLCDGNGVVSSWPDTVQCADCKGKGTQQ